jgi:hypothetical protein
VVAPSAIVIRLALRVWTSIPSRAQSHAVVGSPLVAASSGAVGEGFQRPRSEQDQGMTIGTSLFLIAVGAILRYAVQDTWKAVDIPTVGLILMIVGFFGLILGLYLTFVRGRPDPSLGDEEVVARRRRTRY